MIGCRFTPSFSYSGVLLGVRQFAVSRIKTGEKLGVLKRGEAASCEPAS